MKTVLSLCVIALFLMGCTSRTEFGECVGLGEDKNPTLVYKLDAWNLVVGIVFFELIAPPVIVAVNETFCPVGKK